MLQVFSIFGHGYPLISVFVHQYWQQDFQLQQRIKQEAEQFRQWKASREKELLQVCRQASYFFNFLNLFMLLLNNILVINLMFLCKIIINS